MDLVSSGKVAFTYFPIHFQEESEAVKFKAAITPSFPTVSRPAARKIYANIIYGCHPRNYIFANKHCFGPYYWCNETLSKPDGKIKSGYGCFNAVFMFN